MNIIFDIGKVLIDFDWDGYMRSLFDEKTAKAVTKAMWDNPDWAEFDRGILSDEEVLKLFIASAPKYEREIRKTFAGLGGCPTLKESTIPMIQRLKAMGHKVYFLSNYFEYLMHVCPEALEFIPYTDGGIFSCHVKTVKPEPDIYNILCERYSLDKADSVFIDDSLKNVNGAMAVGIRAIHYTTQSADELISEILNCDI